ncbi:MAG: DUF262 domain-containing protein [Clostridiales bacterium]|nr:DUF262 domain-containing protein [Clostridiales bacterium]
MSKAIQTKNISELKDCRFYVPSYQRGYRWTKYEVTALLDDVNEFRTEGDKRYCIQPLIVKRRDDGSFEVVDGQQRLTTVYIFMKIAEQEIRSATPPYELEYETRNDSAEFLKSLSDNQDLDSDKNIDFFHITAAYEEINNWLDRQPDKSVAIQELNTKFRKSVFFIWYEIPPKIDPIIMFTKVNIGKIPLTNAELIKALLLNKDNFSQDIDKRQMEIALAWDRMEQGLRDDSFWYFLNETEHSGTRIDMLFELLAHDDERKLQLQISSRQNYFPFLIFSAELETASNKEAFVKETWERVEKLFAEFRDWYSDLNKYHIIGFLITSGVEMSEIFLLTRGKRKSEIISNLLERVKGLVGNADKQTLAKLSYGGSNQNKKIRKLLLLLNIATLVCKSEKQYRFPFDIYKGETGDKVKWDIEHIHATADDTDEPDDTLWNLTLLDSRINRSRDYSCSTFDEKRKIITERESKGLFVPLCTKNVFLKAYTNDLSDTDMQIWSANDKKDYIEAMASTFKLFFDGGYAQ